MNSGLAAGTRPQRAHTVPIARQTIQYDRTNPRHAKNPEPIESGARTRGLPGAVFGHVGPMSEMAGAGHGTILTLCRLQHHPYRFHFRENAVLIAGFRPSAGQDPRAPAAGRGEDNGRFFEYAPNVSGRCKRTAHGGT